MGTRPLWTDLDFERKLIDDMSLDEPWDLIEEFSTLVRISGSHEERQAASYIVDRLQSWGVPHQVFEPELYLSVPLHATVDLGSPVGRSIDAKTPSFSMSTGPEGLAGEVVYIPRSPASNVVGVYDPPAQIYAKDIRGRIVLTEGLSGPDEVLYFTERGSIGQIFINPGTRIHWSICSPIWGAPDLDSIGDKPTAAVVDVNRQEGDYLLQMLQQGIVQAIIRTELREGWCCCPLIVAEVKGSSEPEKFVLAHGHLDSWDVGIGDNATGDAALLELARVLWRNRSQLKRTIRLAWWPGHSTGRYAGSTWYADHFGPDLASNCIAHLNIDSPGCRWADHYSHVCWMTELEAFCKKTIMDATGQDAHGTRPYRAGDYSFNNLGISGLFMLLSEIPQEKLKDLDYYPVGGCGGNIGWHTEDDTLEIADRDNLERDIKVYTLALARLANSPVHPLDFIAVLDEHRATLDVYQKSAGDIFDLEPLVLEAQALKAALELFYDKADGLATRSFSEAEVQRVNRTLLELSRLLVTVNFARRGSARQDPAIAIDPLPDLAFVKQIQSLPIDSDDYRFHLAQLVRGRNRALHTYRRAQKLLERVLQD
jgi:hypothetical protein